MVERLTRRDRRLILHKIRFNRCFSSLINHVQHRQNVMEIYQPGAGEPHGLSYFFSHFRLIATNGAFTADRFAAETTGSRTDIINALKKLSAGNLSNLTPHPFYVFLNYSHPPLLERIKVIKKS